MILPALHVVAMPHTHPTDRFSTCAYTAKVKKFCTMMKREGWRVLLYSGEESEAECDEHIPLFTEAHRREHYGEWNPNDLFTGFQWCPNCEPWMVMNCRAIKAIKARCKPRDFLCLVAGHSQSPIAAALPELLPVEWAVGYSGIYFQHKVFESYAWMHYVYGERRTINGVCYDAVIPNFFDPADFPIVEKPSRAYLLFIGRLVQRKGPHIAGMIADRVGMSLVVAGAGATSWSDTEISAPEVSIKANKLVYAGPVNPVERAELMANAAAVIVPTIYIEPFGGVAVEAMLAGTPVIASDWGAFTETVKPGVSGARFRTLGEGAAAVEEVSTLNPEAIRQYAIDNFGLTAVGKQFDQHFKRLGTLWGKGWYE